MPLDPIVSLTVAIAEAPGSYAVLVGSGVSRDAGVPTGSEVRSLALGELYRLENSTEEMPDPDGLAAWLRDTDRENLAYSDILELLTPDAATRRDYLAKHFEGVAPSATHERLAELAVRSLVRVFVVTNFDRLLERALQARGIEPIVVTSDADLAAAPRREHADCFCLKVHGDYLQQTIRNTPAELAQLEPGIATELQEVIDRYGLVVVGYSGSDEAVANAIRSRHSRARYGLYWLARGEVAEPGRSLVEAVGGRVIVRPSAAEFLGDLDRRLAVFEAQPSGLTPVTVNDEVIALLRGDSVGLSEFLRAERREFDERLSSLIARRRRETPTADVAVEVHDELLPVLERRLATLLPLVLHDPELLAQEASWLGELKRRQPVIDGYTFMPEMVDWCLWWLVYSVGAFAACSRRFSVLAPVFDAPAGNRYGTPQFLAKSVPGDGGAHLAESVLARVNPEQKWLDPPSKVLMADLSALTLLVERYPELVASEEELVRSVVEYDFIASIALGVRKQRAVGRWTVYESAANAFAYQLHADARFRGTVAEAVGLALEEFDEQAPAALRAAFALGNFSDLGAINILETGSAH